MTQKPVYHFSHSISVIPEVKAVTFQMESGIIRVWTFILKRDKKIRKSIYMKELDLMDEYPIGSVTRREANLMIRSAKTLLGAL